MGITNKTFILRRAVFSVAAAVFLHAACAPAAQPTAPLPGIAEGAGQAKSQLWVCPMHPQILEEHPAHCPICGMNLVPYRGSSAQASQSSAVHVASATQQLLGVRVVRAERVTLARPIATFGTVQTNLDNVHEITPNAAGLIRKLYVSAVGDRVQVGQPLYQLYSQDLFLRQNDLIDNEDRRRQTRASIAISEQQEQRLLDAAQKSGSALTARQKLNIKQNQERNDLMMEVIIRQSTLLRDRLRFAGMTDAMIAHVLKTRRAYDVFTVRAIRSGYVTQINVHPGSHVEPSTTLLKVADLSRVWIDVALYPDQVARVNEGDSARVKLPFSDAPPASGKISFVSPLADANNVVHARLVLDNPDGRLRPGGFVDVTIRARPHEALAIPRSALMRTGRGDYVMLSLGHGRFLPSPVRTGVEDGDEVEILAGLQPGSDVVVNGQYLLDAAASLASTAQRMQTSAPADDSGR